MLDLATRTAQAKEFHRKGMENVKNNPEPKGQKFGCGSRVKIAEDLGDSMAHFPGQGKEATVEYTYAHAFGGDDVSSYSLNVDGYGSNAWYKEHQLTAID